MPPSSTSKDWDWRKRGKGKGDGKGRRRGKGDDLEVVIKGLPAQTEEAAIREFFSSCGDAGQSVVGGNPTKGKGADVGLSTPISKFVRVLDMYFQTSCFDIQNSCFDGVLIMSRQGSDAHHSAKIREDDLCGLQHSRGCRQRVRLQQDLLQWHLHRGPDCVTWRTPGPLED